MAANSFVPGSLKNDMDKQVNPQSAASKISTNNIINLRDVQVTLQSRAGAVDILRGLDLAVEAGEAVGVVGPSGSGKTTLLMVAGGLEAISGGSIEVAGHNLAAMSEDQLARFRRDHIGIVFQGFHLIATMTALENVAVPLEFNGRADAFEVARNVLERVGLDHRLTHYPSQLSGGEQQRVAIARALAAGALIILADEPTGNLDFETGRAIMDLLFDLQKENGTTLVLVTHDRELAASCDRIVEIRDGQVA